MPANPLGDRDHAMPRYLGPFEIDGRATPTGLKHWSPAGYEDAVCYHVNRICETHTGGAVVRELARKNVRIQPEPEGIGVGAAANGAGTIFFTPGKYIKGYVLYQANPSAIGYGPDETLFHEMFHAMQKLTDTEPPDIPFGLSLSEGEQKKMFPKGLELYQSKKTGMDGVEYDVTEMAIHRKVSTFNPLTGKSSSFESRHDYDSVPEFNAILVANTYISEKSHRLSLCRPPELMQRGEDETTCFSLRKDHAGESSPVPLRDSQDFLENHWTNLLTMELWSSQTTMCRRIALAPAEFNPLRDVVIRAEPERFMVEFLTRYDMSHESLAFFSVAMKRLRRSLGKKKFKAFLNGRVLMPAADPEPKNSAA
jgi:hypothetical protein